MRFLYKGSTVAATTLTAKEMLLQARGGYTTARTYNRTHVFRLEQHLQRLVESSENLGCPKTFLAEIPARAREAMRLVAERIDVESRLTVLCTWQSELDIMCVGEPLPTPPNGQISAVLRNSPRENASCKDTKYVADRALLEDNLGDCHETLLSEGDDVLEGSQTNFFALYPGNVLRTAPLGRILSGTVRAAFLAQCVAAGIKVEETAPSIKEMDSWTAAFISSTSRLLLPLSEIIVCPDPTRPPRNTDKAWRSPRDKVEATLQQLVSDAVEKESSPL